MLLTRRLWEASSWQIILKHSEHTNMHRGRQCKEVTRGEHRVAGWCSTSQEGSFWGNQKLESKEESFPSRFQEELGSAETLIPASSLWNHESRFLLFWITPCLSLQPSCEQENKADIISRWNYRNWKNAVVDDYCWVWNNQCCIFSTLGLLVMLNNKFTDGWNHFWSWFSVITLKCILSDTTYGVDQSTALSV